MNELSVEVYRGEICESVHRVAAVILDERGDLLQSFGDIEQMVFPRSCIKPIQALPLVESGAVSKFNLQARHLALACASHSGELEHTSTVAAWLDMLNLSANDLRCGAHEPYHEPTAHDLIEKREKPNCLHNNCSGKHSGFLSVCKASSKSSEGYNEYEHYIQKALRERTSSCFDFDLDKAAWGWDGCNIPTYAIPLRNLALGFTHWKKIPAAKEIYAAATRNSFYVAGSERFDTLMMSALKGDVLTKTGAEGVHIAFHWSKGISIAVKALDGAERAAKFAIGNLIRSQGWLTEGATPSLQNYIDPQIYNRVGKLVGRILMGAQ